jgi:RimJ/RimL family protein N-acetyltransferase
LTGRTWQGEATLEGETNWIKQVLQQDDSIRFAICIGDDEMYVGNIQLTNINNHSAWFHVFIGEELWWGKGIASRATHQLLEYTQNETQIQTVFLKVKKENLAARRIYEKAGFYLDEEADDDLIMSYTLERNKN